MIAWHRTVHGLTWPGLMRSPLTVFLKHAYRQARTCSTRLRAKPCVADARHGDADRLRCDDLRTARSLSVQQSQTEDGEARWLTSIGASLTLTTGQIRTLMHDATMTHVVSVSHLSKNPEPQLGSRAMFDNRS